LEEGHDRLGDSSRIMGLGVSEPLKPDEKVEQLLVHLQRNDNAAGRSAGQVAPLAGAVLIQLATTALAAGGAGRGAGGNSPRGHAVFTSSAGLCGTSPIFGLQGLAGVRELFPR
jgi:hypothetical protein